MTTSTLLLQQTASLAPMLAQLARYAAMAALLLVFRPLLMGMLRAAVLLVRPRLSREQRAIAARA